MILSEIYAYIFGDRAIIIPDKRLETEEMREKRMAYIHSQEERIRKLFGFLVSDDKLHPALLSLLTTINTSSSNSLKTILFGDEKINLPPEALENIRKEYDDETIKNLFHSLNSQFKYFPDDETFLADFIIFFKATKLFEYFVEPNHYGGNEQVADLAYKMLVVFGAAEGNNVFSNVDVYLNDHTLKGKVVSLHDALVQGIPVNDPPLKDLEGWQAFIKKFGAKGLEFFQEATGIEEKLEGKAPRTKQEAEKAASQLNYQRANEYPALARLCKKYHLSEVVFNKCLEVEKKRKKKDLLPDVSVDGKEISSEFAGYHVVKFPIDDPRAYVLGHITNCCQSIGGHSEQCVIDGVTREKNGFYVLLKGKPNAAPLIDGKINDKDFEIVGQAYAWLSRHDNFVFDSWENLRPESDDRVVAPLLTKFAEKAMAANDEILQVTIGTGGKTPKSFNWQAGTPELIAEGNQYGDSARQCVVFRNKKKLTVLIEKLIEKFDPLKNPLCQTKNEFSKFINRILCPTSMKEMNWIHEIFLNDELFSLLKNNKYDEWVDWKFGCPGDAPTVLAAKYTLEALHILYEKKLLNDFYAENARNEQFAELLLKIPLKFFNNDNLTLFATRLNESYESEEMDRDSIPNVIYRFNRLYQSYPELASDKDLKMLLADPKNAMYIGETLRCLYKINPQRVNDENRQFLASHPNQEWHVWKELERIFEVNPALVTDENRLLLAENPKDANEVSWAVVKLYELNPLLVSDKNFKLLTLHPKLAGALRENMENLNKVSPQLANDENFKFMAQHFGQGHNELNDIATVLIYLYKGNPALLTDENRQLLIENTNKCGDVGFGLYELFKANPALVTNENFRFLLADSNPRANAEALAILYQANPLLVNEENRQLLAVPKKKTWGMGLDWALKSIYKLKPALVTDKNFKLLAATENPNVGEGLERLHKTNPALVNDNIFTLLVLSESDWRHPDPVLSIEKIYKECLEVSKEKSLNPQGLFAKSSEPQLIAEKVIKYLLGDTSVQFSEQEISGLAKRESPSGLNLDSWPREGAGVGLKNQ